MYFIIKYKIMEKLLMQSLLSFFLEGEGVCVKQAIAFK